MPRAGGGRGTQRRARQRLGLPFAALAGITLLIAACGCGNSSGTAGASSPATTPAPPFLYAVNTKSDEVSQYTINQNTGRLTPKSPATVASGRGRNLALRGRVRLITAATSNTIAAAHNVCHEAGSMAATRYGSEGWGFESLRARQRVGPPLGFIIQAAQCH